MILLKFVSQVENEIDEVLMVVPDGYKREEAFEVADEAIAEPALVGAWALIDLMTGGDLPAEFRKYVGEEAK